jgi:hypothetical protein
MLLEVSVVRLLSVKADPDVEPAVEIDVNKP